MSPDPNALMTTSASDALLNSQALQRKSTRNEIATLAVQATATAARFNTFITAVSMREKPALVGGAILPDGTISIGCGKRVQRWPGASSSSLIRTKLSLRAAAKTRS
jgi:hypothetical protein